MTGSTKVGRTCRREYNHEHICQGQGIEKVCKEKRKHQIFNKPSVFAFSCSRSDRI